MSITRRILEGAQSGLSRLTSLVIVDDEPLSHVESASLQVELAARKAARTTADRAAADNPLARLASADPASRSAREKQARERASRVHKDRDERAARAKAAADETMRRLKEEAARGGPWHGAASSGASGARSGNTSTGSSRSPRPGSGAGSAQLAEWYKVLDVSVGAEMPAIKTAYRQMMRKYHPDMHAGNPSKQKAATELSVRVTTAYNGLVAHFEKK